jgi:hypothetical protein
MIERQLVQILAPLADRIIELEKQLAAVAARPVVKEFEPIDVQALAKAAAELVTVPTPINGADGAPGAPGTPGEKGEKGDKGDAPAVEEVAALLKSDASLIDLIKGTGIKSISMTADSALMDIELTNGEQFEVHLPVGPQGAQGEKGERGAVGAGIDLPLYEKGAVYREGSQIMAHLGKVYEALKDTYSQPPSADWKRIGTFGHEWRGVHKDGNVYEDGDLYIDGGSTFMWLSGKGHMVAQRGRQGLQGEKGERGLQGLKGEDAPKPVHGIWTPKSASIFMSDGSELEFEVEGYEKHLNTFVRAVSMNFLEEQLSEVRAEGGVPLRSFKGQFESSRKYREGDVVTFNKTMWVARGSTSGEFSDDRWFRMITVVGGGGSGGVRMTTLADVNQHSKPTLGEVPIWKYPAGHESDGKFQWGTPNVHLKPWDSTVSWEAGATVVHDGRLWRAVFDNTNVEPAFEEGKITLFFNVPGEPSFGIVPMFLSSAEPPSGEQAVPPSKYAYHVQYTAPNTYVIWKFVLKGVNPITHRPFGEWEGRPWTCIVWRGIVPPPKSPPGTVMVWLYGPPTSTHAPVLGQQKWAPVDIASSLTMAVDVDAGAPKDNDILVYNAITHKWTAVAGKTWWTSMQTAP